MLRRSLRRAIALALLFTLVLVYGISRRSPSSAEPQPLNPSVVNTELRESDYAPPLPPQLLSADSNSYQSFAGIRYPLSPRAFLETFDGTPTRPLPWRSSSVWDVSIHSRDVETWHQLLPLEAQTGPNCEPAPATHRVREYQDTVFQCNDHLSTAINGAAHAAVYLTPAVITQFSAESITIRFDISTERFSNGDWIDIWITPFDDQLIYPLEPWQPDLTGYPRNGIHVRMDASWNTIWYAEQISDFQAERIAATSNGWQGYETFLPPSSTERETFELTLSATYIRFGMPEYDFWWVDRELDKPLTFSEGIVQFGHHSTSPAQNCEHENGLPCKPNTWEWDNILIDPATPFTMLPADARYVDQSTERTVFFNHVAPKDAMLRFAGIGTNLAVSFDGGESWIAAELQAQSNVADEKFKSYWMPIPKGTKSVTFRGEAWWGGSWHVRDIAIWKR